MNRTQFFYKYARQQDQVFGFISLTSLDVKYKLGDLGHFTILSQHHSDPIAFHKIVRESQEYNYKKYLTQLSDSINFDFLFRFSHDYWDYQHFTILKYGLLLDFNRQDTLLHASYLA